MQCDIVIKKVEHVDKIHGKMSPGTQVSLSLKIWTELLPNIRIRRRRQYDRCQNVARDSSVITNAFT